MLLLSHKWEHTKVFVLCVFSSHFCLSNVNIIMVFSSCHSSIYSTVITTPKKSEVWAHPFASLLIRMKIIFSTFMYIILFNVDYFFFKWLISSFVALYQWQFITHCWLTMNIVQINAIHAFKALKLTHRMLWFQNECVSRWSKSIVYQ